MTALGTTFDDCIFCGGDNGSAEHTVLAALGGLRTDRGILCVECNNGFSSLDASLADDMRSLNAAVGVQNGRTKNPVAVSVEDVGTGRTYVLSEGRQLRHPDPVVLDDRTVDGVRNLYAVASTQHQADEFLRQLRAEGKPVKVNLRERVPLLFASPPTMVWNFGGPHTLRAVARIALSVLAHHFPSRAREPWLAAFKQFIRQGGPTERWVRYEYTDEHDPRLPDGSFPFQHRFLLGFDATSQLAYARVSLLGVAELMVLFGNAPTANSETLVHDVNVIATHGPDDVRVHRIPDLALDPPVAPTANPLPFVQKRLPVLMAKRADWLWQQDSPRLVAALNETRNAAQYERHERIVDALRGQEQRLLNLAAFIVSDFKRHLTEQFGDEAAAVVNVLAPLVQADGKSRTGVSDLTAVHADMLRYVMADHLLPLLEDHAIDGDELRSLIEGWLGAAAVGTYMMQHLQRAHPELGLDEARAAEPRGDGGA
jgi:hypothetical protein